MATVRGGGEPAATAEAPRILSTPRQRLLAAAVAATVLGVGYAARPEEPVAARVEEAPGPLLQQAVQQRAPQPAFDELQRTGAGSLPYVAGVSAAPRPVDFWSDLPDAEPAAGGEQYGVVVGPDEILAAAGPLRVGDAVAIAIGDGRQIEGVVTATFRDRGLVLISAVPSSPFARPEPAAGVEPGTAVVAVGVGAEGPVIAPLFVAGRAGRGIRAATPLDSFQGMGVFTGGGGLVGIIARTADGSRILPLDAALAPVPYRDPLPPVLGLALALTPDGGDPGGVTVAAIDAGGAAAALGLQRDDVPLDADGQPFRSAEAARAVLVEALARRVPVAVRRGGQVVTLQPPDAPPAR